MEPSDVRIVAGSDRHVRDLATAFTHAFDGDPMFAWLAGGDPTRHRRLAPACFEAQIRYEFLPHGLVDVAQVGGATVGGALWKVEPGRGPGRRGDAEAQRRRRPRRAAGTSWASARPWLHLAGPRVAAFGVMAARAHAFHPREPFLYLETIALTPQARGHGLARRLLAQRLERARTKDMPVYLESTKPGNVAIYEHFGFRVVGRPDIPGGPPIWSMVRPAGD